MMIHYTRRDITCNVHRGESRVGTSYMMSTNCVINFK